MSKILYISYDGLTDPLGQSQVIPYLIGLAKKGYEIHILSCEKREAFEERKGLISEILTEHDIIWHPIFYRKFPPVLSTIYDIIQLKKIAIRLHKVHRFNIIHCRSYIAAHIGLWMKKSFDTKFIFDMRGFWADERVDGKLWNLTNPIFKGIYNYFKRMERRFFQEADYIISLTYNGKEIISSGGLNYEVKTPIEVIPCCVDLELFQTKQTKKKNQNFILSYIGSISTWYMLDEMLDFFKVLMLKLTNANFLFVTREPKEWILDRCRIKGIEESSILIESAERKEVPAYIEQSDASIFFIKPVFSKRASSPTKQGEIMAMGVPIICNANVGDTDYVIKKYNAGILVRKFCVGDYEKAINKLLSMKFDTLEIKKGAEEFYSLEMGVEKYAKIYDWLE